MNGDYLSALALLKTSYDQNGQTYLDYVTPFVGDAIRATGRDALTVSEIRTELKTRYGLDVPEGALATMTKRLVRAGYGKRENRKFVPDVPKLAEDYNFDARRAASRLDIEALSSKLVGYAASEVGLTLTSAEATVALTAYADRNGLPILRRAILDRDLPQSLSLIDTEYVTSRFVIHAFDHDPEARDSLVMLAKGSKLASVLYLPDPGEATRKIGNLTAYFDTPVVLSALGYQGKEPEAAARGVLELAYRNGIELAMFDHSLAELESILETVGSKVGRSGYAGRPTRGVEAHFLAKGMNASDIKLLVGQLDRDLTALRLHVEQRPPAKADWTTNESKLEQLLSDGVGYSRKAPMLHDLDALTSVFRLRKARLPRKFEDSRVVFVTQNTSLSRTATSFFREEYGDHFPVSITDDDFATLLWLKLPLAAPDLPAQRVISDAHSALEPGMVKWEAYLVELDRLRDDETISEDDYYFLRYSTDAKDALMVETLGAGSGISADQVKQIVERVQASIRKPVEAKHSEAEQALVDASHTAETERSLREALEAERDAAVEAAALASAQVDRVLDNQARRSRAKATSRARNVRIVVAAAALIAICAGIWFSAPTDWSLPPQDTRSVVRWLARISVGLLFVATLVNLIFGWHLAQQLRRLELWLATRFEARFRKQAGLDS